MTIAANRMVMTTRFAPPMAMKRIRRSHSRELSSRLVETAASSSINPRSWARISSMASRPTSVRTSCRAASKPWVFAISMLVASSVSFC
jgi:hypothetical protein